MKLNLISIFAMCAFVWSAATHPSLIRSTSYGGYAVLPIWTEDFGVSYLVNVSIGSDNQTLPLIFDTASPDTFLNPDCFNLPDEVAKGICLARPRYNAFTSTTSKFSGGSFSLTYEAGWGEVAGTYISDDIHIGSTTINAKHVGIAATSRSFAAGLFGAGRSTLGEQPSMIEQMVSQGQISNHVFSINLGPLDDVETGTLILGGIDTKRYQGFLTMLEGTGFNTYLTAMGLTLPNGTSIAYDPTLWTPNNNTTSLPVSLDSNSKIDLMPDTLVQAIADTYPQIASRGSDQGTATLITVPCDVTGGSFDYTFANLTIHVPFSDALAKQPDGTCVLPFSSRPASDGAADHQGARPFVLGNNVMRAAYVFFDLQNEHIWMGTRADCGSRVVAVGNGVETLEGCSVDDYMGV